jgi:hypothetical protein
MKDAAHLVRLAMVFAGALAVFLLVRQQVAPSDFGKYGHYRPSALDQNRSQPLAHAGRQACEMCHEDQLKVLQAGKHAGVGCEACHGPLAAHANDPGTPKPALPQAKLLCVRCHEANSAKPKGFPQVVSKEHSGGEDCKSCHLPHRPKFPKEG